MLARYALMPAAFGCSSSTSTPDAPVLRPGVEDSSQTYMGTPNANESAFWTAVRDADDTGRAAAVEQLSSDITADPSNGYSEFLIGASYFMPPNTILSALANGTQPPQFQASPAAIPILQQSLGNLTDPFYLGFSGGLLGFMLMQGGDIADGQQAFATAVPFNHAATGFMKVIADEVQHNPSGALDDMYALFEFCNGGSLDRTGAEAASYVAKMNSGALAHRECYSGYFAPHGSSGELLVMADLHALNGNQQAATAYYNAVKSTSDYATWALQPLVQRRVSGAQPADLGTTTLVTGSCVTCHTDKLQ